MDEKSRKKRLLLVTLTYIRVNKIQIIKNGDFAYIIGKTNSFFSMLLSKSCLMYVLYKI